MHYQVPQFIDIEDKIIGPLTIKQFVYLAAGFLIIFFSFFVLKPIIWFMVALIIGSISLALAFVKYNGKSFLSLVIAVLKYFWKPRVYVWQKNTPQSMKANKSSLLENLNLKLNTFKQKLKRKSAISLQDSFVILRKNTGEQEVARRVDYK